MNQCFTQSSTVAGQWFGLSFFFETGTKLKVPSQMTPPLTPALLNLSHFVENVFIKIQGQLNFQVDDTNISKKREWTLIHIYLMMQGLVPAAE